MIPKLNVNNIDITERHKLNITLHLNITEQRYF